MRITKSDLNSLNYYVGIGNFNNSIWLFGNEEGCGKYTVEDNLKFRINEVSKHNQNICYSKDLPQMTPNSTNVPHSAYISPYVKVMKELGSVPTFDLRPLMREDQSIPYYKIEEYKDIIPDKKTESQFFSAFRMAKKANQFTSVANTRIQIIRQFVLNNKPKIILALGEQDTKISIFKDLMQVECMDLDKFVIMDDKNKHKHKLSDLPKTYIYKAKNYKGYFVFIYHPNYISRGLGKDKYKIAQAGPVAIYCQIVKQLLDS